MSYVFKWFNIFIGSLSLQDLSQIWQVSKLLLLILDKGVLFLLLCALLKQLCPPSFLPLQIMLLLPQDLLCIVSRVLFVFRVFVRYYLSGCTKIVLKWLSKAKTVRSMKFRAASWFFICLYYHVSEFRNSRLYVLVYFLWGASFLNCFNLS